MPNTAADSQHLHAVNSPAEESWLHVVAGVIVNAAGDEILLARRPTNKHQGGKWEFPGGKVEVGESSEYALRRELEEELGILAELTEITPFLEVRHRYPDKNIFLDIKKVSKFSGEPRGCEGQAVKWFSLSELNNLDFPAANAPIVEKLLTLK